MSNVVSLSEKLERWSKSYESPCGRLIIFSSSHGRFNLVFERQSIKLDMVNSVKMLTDLSEGMSSAMNVIFQ